MVYLFRRKVSKKVPVRKTGKRSGVGELPAYTRLERHRPGKGKVGRLKCGAFQRDRAYIEQGQEKKVGLKLGYESLWERRQIKRVSPPDEEQEEVCKNQRHKGGGG